MDNVKILEVKQSIFASNDEQAAALRAELNHDTAPHDCCAAK